MQNTVTGNAKKYSGEAIDRVVMFDWATAALITQITPDMQGDWSFTYTDDLFVGLTYIAASCKPITHGPYGLFIERNETSVVGYILLSAATSNNKYLAHFDKEAVDHPDWATNFESVLEVGLLDYVYGVGTPAEATLKTKIINQFSDTWILEINSDVGTWASDDSFMTFEILNEANQVIFALKTYKEGSYVLRIKYGVDLDNLTNIANRTYPYAMIGGTLEFTATGVKYTNTLTGNFNSSFEYAVDVSSGVRMRVSGSAKGTYSGGGSTGLGYIKVLP